MSQSNQPLGAITFNTTLTDNGSGTGGNSIASFLLGYPQQESRIVSLFYPHYNTKEPFVFVQDDWRATSNLTLNLGLRYDVFTPYTEQDNHLVNVNLATSTILVAGQNGVSRTANISTDHSNLAPRVGFSATLPRQMVLRGGYGMSYFPGNYMSQSFLKSAPFTSTFGPVISTGASGGVPNLLLSNGLPAPVATDITVPTGTFQAEELDFKNTRTQQYNLFVEKEFSGNVIGGGYLGWRQDHLAQYIRQHGPRAGGGRRHSAAPRLLLDAARRQLDSADRQRLRRHLRRDAGRVLAPAAATGSTVSANYTLAHAQVTNASPWDVNVVERYDSDFDVRHRVVLSANYELPSPTATRPVTRGGARRLADQRRRLLADRHGVHGGQRHRAQQHRRHRSAEPGRRSRARATRRSSSGSTSPPTPRSRSTPPATPAATRCTDRRSAASTCRCSRTSPIHSSTRLQLRAEVFNITNTPSFATPNANFGTAGFGSITSTGNAIPRQMQFAAKLLF